MINDSKETIYHKRNQNANKCICLLYQKNHFDVIISPSGFFNRSYFCDLGKKGYDITDNVHVCIGGKYCRNCKVSVVIDHKSFIQKSIEKITKKLMDIFFFDF